MFNQILGQRDTVGAGRLQADECGSLAETGQPSDEASLPLGGVIKFRLPVFTLGQTGDIELGLGDIHADNHRSHGFSFV